MLEDSNHRLGASASSAGLVNETTVPGYGLESTGKLSSGLTPVEVAADTALSSAALQDFNGDGWSDILWRDSVAGAAALLLWDGSQVQQEVALKPYVQGGAWQIQGVGQFNEDDSPDLLWRNTLTGQSSIWLMDGVDPIDAVALPTVTDQDWQVLGVGNFEPERGSRADDLLWYNSRTGERVVWLMDGTERRDRSLLEPQRDAPGILLGSGDFDGNGTMDLLWQRASGELLVWKLDGLTFVEASDLAETSPGGTAEGEIWRINGIADYNRDGRADILWQRRHGERAAAIAPSPSPTTVEPTPVDITNVNPGAGSDRSTRLTSSSIASVSLPSKPSQPLVPWELRLWEVNLSQTGTTPPRETVLFDAFLSASYEPPAPVNQDGQPSIWPLVSGRLSPDQPLAANPVPIPPTSEPPLPKAPSSGLPQSDSPVIDVVTPSPVAGAVPPNVVTPEAVTPPPIAPAPEPVRETVLAADSPPPVGDTPASDDEFNIEFDYRFDSQNWFTPERRAALEAAADVWERIILDDFPTTPAGVDTPFVRHPETDQYVDATGQRSTIYKTDVPIDDAVILVGTQSLGSQGSLGLAAASGFFNDDPRYAGNRFQPWLGSLTINRDVNWFFDPTPLTDDDIPVGRSDFISTAVHEIGHILGFSRSIPAFARYVSVSNNANVPSRFVGPNAIARTNGLGIPLEDESSHIQDGFELDGSGETALDPVSFLGKRQLPTVLDAAIFADLGYTVDYSQVAQNLPDSA